MRTGKTRRQYLGASLGFALASFAALSGTGCYKATFVQGPTDTTKREPTHERWTHHYMLGLAGKGDHDTSELCPDGVSMVRTAGDASTGAVTVLTFGVYSPRKLYVTCAVPAAAASAQVTR
jgi:Bor protein